jgi:hypothetical protein
MARAIQAFADALPVVVWSTTGVCILILAPLGLFQKTRWTAGAYLYSTSYVFGAILWIYGAVATFAYWGWVGLLVGLLALGVGVVPMGLLALALQSQWEWLLNLGGLFLMMVITRLGGAWFINSAERKKYHAW